MNKLNLTLNTLRPTGRKARRTTMDPYALKQDNRKKFKDKQKAKQRHATPSDRKYRALKRQEQAHQEDEEETKPPPPSNEHRYHEDITMAYGDMQDEERNTHANKRVRELLKTRDDSELDFSQERRSNDSQSVVTRRELEKMDVTDLNRFLGRSHTPDLVQHQNDPLAPPTPVAKPQEKKRGESNLRQNVSTLPEELQDDEAFLDQFI